VAINMWAVPLLRYTGGILKWSQAELKAIDISTRKLLALYKCFNVNDDVDRLYVPRCKGGHGLLSVEDTILHEQLSIKKYLACSAEPLLQTVYQSSQHSTSLESPTNFKAKRKQEHFEAWRDYQVLGLLSTFTLQSYVKAKTQLYTALVKSQFFYCSVIWKPHLIKHIQQLEQVQRRATKFILNDYCSDGLQSFTCYLLCMSSTLMI